MIIFLYAGPTMFDIKYNMIETPYRVDGKPTYRLQHYTFLFNTFNSMTLFNMWNCRVLPIGDKRELNIFQRIWTNWWFVIVFLAEVNFTYFMTSYNWTSYIFDTTPTTLAMQLTSIGVGLGTWLVALIVKFIPSKYFVWFRIPEDEDSAPKGKFGSALSSAVAFDASKIRDEDDY